jgi:hypothetical protein
MAGDLEESDFWGVLVEAEQTVERWPEWQQRVEADPFYGTPPAPFLIRNS